MCVCVCVCVFVCVCVCVCVYREGFEHNHAIVDKTRKVAPLILCFTWNPDAYVVHIYTISIHCT